MSSGGFDFNPFDFYLKSSLCYYKYSLNHVKGAPCFFVKNGDLTGLLHCTKGFLCFWLNTEHSVIYIFILG